MKDFTAFLEPRIKNTEELIAGLGKNEDAKLSNFYKGELSAYKKVLTKLTESSLSASVDLESYTVAVTNPNVPQVWTQSDEPAKVTFTKSVKKKRKRKR